MATQGRLVRPRLFPIVDLPALRRRHRAVANSQLDKVDRIDRISPELCQPIDRRTPQNELVSATIGTIRASRSSPPCKISTPDRAPGTILRWRTDGTEGWVADEVGAASADRLASLAPTSIG